ncbi:MAG: hypothetical protein J6V72_11070 [Kiritimatiellae bacterium]|nr:hypothetical protein [Kiritimatiellia bacterium]
MREQMNAEIDCDVARLDFPLRKWKAKQGHNFVARFRRVPADVSGLFARVFKENGAYFDVTGVESPDGGWTVRIPAACFPTVGDFKYEVHATASDGEPAAIGEGQIAVAPFSVTTTPITPGTVQVVSQIPCEGGGMVQVVMKWDGFEWVMEAINGGSDNA